MCKWLRLSDEHYFRFIPLHIITGVDFSKHNNCLVYHLQDGTVITRIYVNAEEQKDILGKILMGEEEVVFI